MVCLVKAYYQIGDIHSSCVGDPCYSRVCNKWELWRGRLLHSLIAYNEAIGWARERGEVFAGNGYRDLLLSFRCLHIGGDSASAITALAVIGGLLAGKKMLGKAWHGGWAALSQVQILTGEFNIPGHQSYSNLAYASRKYSPKLLNGNRFGVRVLRTTCRELESNVSNRSISDTTKCGLLCRSYYERYFSDNTDRDRNCKIIEPWW